MSFDYEKTKAKMEDSSHGNSWTAYSDLFMMLSTVFLLLYVSVSVRSQTSGIEIIQKVKQLTEKNKDLEQQIQVYNTLRDNHLKTEASQAEQEAYQKLMSKLDLLKEEAKDEKERLRQEAKENENKEYALNEYQRMIRNIINTNVLSKTQIKKADVIIEKKDTINSEQKVVIKGQEKQITALNADIAEKQEEIARNREKIKRVNHDLQKRIASLHQQQKEAEISKAQMNKKIAALKAESEKTLKNLEHQNKLAQNELNHVQSTLMAAQREVQEKEAQLASAQQQMASLKAGFADRESKLKADFEASLNRERITGDERVRRQAEFAAAAKQREAALANKLSEMGGKLNELGGKVQEAEGAARRAEADRLRAEAEKGRAEAEKGRALATVQGLEKDKAALSADLKRAQDLANARKMLAQRIKGELHKAGLKGDVDEKTGDVTLSFGEEYFDTGSAKLKPSMEATLRKFMPGYSKSLFHDEKMAKNIDNVEIIGFASSTYQGRYVPPDSLRPEDREAINYNLKLSFNRADSIFRHIFDTKKMSFEHQRDLLPKIKVVGRGYLPEGKTGSEIPAGISEQQFCKKYSCKQAQKVIIKFKLKD